MRTWARTSGTSWCVAAVAVTLVVLCSSQEAFAYRRGLASSMGGATLGRGHVLYLATGYPRTSLGWAVALHPLVDLGLHADVVYGSPIVLGDRMMGGGGGVRGRVALVRGRLSAALVFGVGAVAFGEGGGAAALVDLGSPSAEISIRLGDRVALHAAIRVVLQYVTAPLLGYITTAAQIIGGFEGRVGATVGLGERIALVASATYGSTLWEAQESATARFEVLAGLEYRLATGERGARPRRDDVVDGDH